MTQKPIALRSQCCFEEAMENTRANGEEAGGKGSNEFEQQKVGLLRSLVEKQDPTSKELDDMMLKRFLRAHELDVQKASNMLLKYLKWRREFVPDGLISESEIPNELASKKIFMQGTDKKGCPIGVYLAAKHIPNKADGGADEFKRCLVYLLDKMCARTQAGLEEVVFIADLQGWGFSNLDLRGYQGAISIVQDFYPERVGKLYLVHVPFIFVAALKILYPFIDKNLRKKLCFVDNKQITSTLLQDIDESQLPQIYGGKLPLVSIEDS